MSRSMIWLGLRQTCLWGMGLGIRRVALLAPSAFLASAAATQELKSDLLPLGGDYHDSDRDLALAIWTSRYNAPTPWGWGPDPPENRWTGHQLPKDRLPWWPGALTPTTELACTYPEPPTAVLGYTHGQLQHAASAWTMKPYESLLAYDLGLVYVPPHLLVWCAS